MEQKSNKPQLFKPGEGGRPKGVKNKVTREQKIQVEHLLSLLDDVIEDYIMKLKPEKAVELWLNLQEYIRPKKQRVSLDTEEVKDNKVEFTFKVVPAGKRLEELPNDE